MQPEIEFINKLIRMRKRAEKLKVTKVNRMRDVTFLESHLTYNNYNTPEKAKGFFIRHSERIHNLIGVRKGKLEDEYNNFLQGAK